MEQNTKNFEQAKIYCIECNITGKKYIGSTCKTLSQRLKQHEYQYKRYLIDKYCYVTSFDILQLDDYTMYLLEKVHCDTQEELDAFEGHYIKKFRDFAVNKRVEGKTKLEKKEEIQKYYQDNKESKKKYQQQYREDNRELVNQKQREKILCECGIQYSRSHKARHIKTTHHQEFIADQDDE